MVRMGSPALGQNRTVAGGCFGVAYRLEKVC